MRTMGVKIREWKGAWWVFINHQGTRKAKRIGTGESGKKAAKQVAQQIQARLALGQAALPERTRVTLQEYAARWLAHIRQVRKHTTHEDYQKRLDRWLLPALGSLHLPDITREKVRSMVTEQLNSALSPKTVQNNVRVLSSLLSQAVEDNLIPVNVALKPGKFLPKVSKRRQVNPFTREEVSIFLATAQRHASRYYPLFLCAVRTGLRLGELLALQWGDLDFQSRFLLVQRNYTHGKMTSPKNGEVRRVDMSRELTQALSDLHLDRQLQASTNGWPGVPEWVFCSEAGGLLDGDNLRHRAFYALLNASATSVNTSLTHELVFMRDKTSLTVPS
ncbi:MAG: site-specific integrase [Nitrospira sp.]|nr:site-specific integrase [Nitrospira sp.]